MILDVLLYLFVRVVMILLAVVVCLATVVWLRIRRKPKPGPNPFSTDQRRDPQPIILNEKARDAILKKRFASADLSARYDTIVIGSGCSGMTTAVVLSKAGQRVLVLEQHDQAGGYCHTFLSKGFEFDTGVHYIGKMQEGHKLRRMMDQITEGQVQWQPMEDSYDMVMGTPSNEQESRRWVPIKAGTQRYIDTLSRHFPKETRAIRKFVKLVETYRESIIDVYILKFIPYGISEFLIKTGLYKLISKCYRKDSLANTKLSDVVKALTDNEELRVCLTYAILNVGSDPNKAPLGIHSTLVDHYIDGAFYPVGGPSEVVLQLCQIIRRCGGDVLCSAPVNEILFDHEGKACGVEVGQKKVKLYADRIVSSTGLDVTFNKLIPKSIAQKSFVYPFAQSMKPSMGCVFLFVGLEGTPEELGLQANNYWICDYKGESWASYIDSYFELSLEQVMEEDPPFPYIFFSCGYAKDPICKEKFPGQTAVSAVIMVPYKWFEEFDDERKGRRGDRYEIVKSYFTTRMWHKVLEFFPQLDGKVLHMEGGTPVTNNYYDGKRFGECFGTDLTVSRMDAIHQATLRPQTGIPGLFLTGVDITVAGMVPAAIAGVMTSSIILRRNVREDINKLYNQLEQEGKC